MRSLADFEFNKAPLCDGMILISEMIRDDFTSQYVYAELENLVSPGARRDQSGTSAGLAIREAD